MIQLEIKRAMYVATHTELYTLLLTQAMETVEASRVDYASALADLGFIPQDVLKFVKRV